MEIVPIPIDEDLLRKVTQQHALEEAEPPPEFSEVITVNLSGKNIREIGCLWDFTSLTKLALNENLIKKIHGLENLINLTWLDMSFNKIEKIEGLESLQKLEVLNLAENKISAFENMEKLVKLTHFIFSNNLIQQLDSVLYLRKFKKLFAVHLHGNPAFKAPEYKLFIAAYFPNLKFLDFKGIDAETRIEASIKYHDDLEKLELEELQIQQAEEAKRSMEAELKLHKDAFVEFLNGPFLFKSMFEDDPEAETIHRVPKVASFLQTFENQMVKLCQQVFETGLAEHRQREAEVNAFLAGQKEALNYYQQKQIQVLAKFTQEHRERMEEVQKLSNPEVLKVKITRCSEEIDLLCKSLMTLEYQLIRQLRNNIKIFDKTISEMIGNFSEVALGIFAQCRGLENDYHNKVQTEASKTLRKVARNSEDEELPDDVIMLFTDKDIVMDALNTSHNNHMLKINDRETELLTGLHDWKANIIKESEDKELRLNRTHISDIYKYKDYLREQLEEFQ